MEWLVMTEVVQSSGKSDLFNLLGEVECEVIGRMVRGIVGTR